LPQERDYFILPSGLRCRADKHADREHADSS
jgi:hypothetical protein